MLEFHFSFQHRYVVENIREQTRELANSAAPSPYKKHVLVLLQLPRGNWQSRVPLDFNKRWKFAYVDAIETHNENGLPDARTLLGLDRAMKNIFPYTDLRKVFAVIFRGAMAKLVYPYPRTNDDVRAQIKLILSCLENDALPPPSSVLAARGTATPMPEDTWTPKLNTAPFLACLRWAMCAMLQNCDDTLDVSEAIAKEGDLSMRGTFQNCLHEQIRQCLTKCSTVVLGHAEQNCSFNLLGSAPAEHRVRVYELWHYLFKRSFIEMGLHEHLKTAGSNSKVRVGSNGTEGHKFQSRFPFSFYLFSLLESLQSSTMAGGANANDAARLEQRALQQFHLLKIECRLCDPLSSYFLRMYILDFTHMQLRKMRKGQVLTLEVTADLLTTLLVIAGQGAPIQRVSDVHVRYWLCEHTTHAVLSLLEAVPSASGVVLAKLKSQNAKNGLDPGVELSVCHAMQQYLVETITNVQSMAQARLFSDSVRALRLGFVEVVNRVDSSLATASFTPEKTSMLQNLVGKFSVSQNEWQCIVTCLA